MAKLVKQSLGQEATDLLRTMLLNGRFKAGERLVEDRIAAELGISRTPLREALHRLAQEGILEKRRAGGYEVRTLRRREVEDAIDIRTMLEAHAAALAAERCTAEHIAALKENMAHFGKAHAAHDIPRLVELNTEFHTLLRAAAHAPLLSRLLEELDGVVERMIRPIISKEEASWSDADHLVIFRSIEQHNADAAATAMREHIAHGKLTILSQFEE